MSQKWERKFYLSEFRSITRALSNYGELPMLINYMVEGISRTFEVQGQLHRDEESSGRRERSRRKGRPGEIALGDHLDLAPVDERFEPAEALVELDDASA